MAVIWTPAQLPGLLAWTQYRRDVVIPDDLVDSAGGAGETATGSGATRPRLVRSMMGLSTQHTQHRLTYGTALGKPTEWSVCTLFRPDTLSSRWLLGGSIDAAGSSTLAWALLEHNNTTHAGCLRVQWGSGAAFRIVATPPVLVAGDWALATVVYSGGASAAIRINGVDQSVSNVAGTATSTAGAVASYSIGAGGAFAGLWYPGLIGEYVTGGSAWTTDEVARVEGYVAHARGRAADLLPAEHPYRDAPPAAGDFAGTATKSGGGAADLVLVHDAVTYELVGSDVPSPTGEWDAHVEPGVYRLTYLAAGCQPITHGPYTVEPE